MAWPRVSHTIGETRTRLPVFPLHRSQCQDNSAIPIRLRARAWLPPDLGECAHQRSEVLNYRQTCSMVQSLASEPAAFPVGPLLDALMQNRMEAGGRGDGSQAWVAPERDHWGH